MVYWQCENRATSYVEYGETAQYGRKTPLSPISWVVNKPYFTQWHRITGLAAGKEYHYRTVSIGTDGKEARGEDRTFKTRALPDAIAVPGDLKGPPYVLDKPNAVYRLTQDITAPMAAIEIKGDGVTLEMDGHTITYNSEAVEFPDDKWTSRLEGPKAVYGVKISAKKPVKLLNGTIRQGKGRSNGSAVGYGSNPLYTGGPPNGTEIGAVEFVWSGASISGLIFGWGAEAIVHHCTMEDLGTQVMNRHQAISTIDGNGGGDYDHNLVKGTRQQGLNGARSALYNEVYINSYVTNSFGISARAGNKVDIGFNKVIGTGNHPVAFAMMGAFLPLSKLHDNYCEVMCTRKSNEYGWTGSGGLRTTWGGDYLDVYGNTFIGYSKARERGGLGSVGHCRLLWVGLPEFTPKGAKEPIKDARGIFHNNTFIARGLDDDAKACGIGVVCHNQSPNLIFLNNTVISTWGDVLLSDDYGNSEGYPKFIGNTFKREGKDPSFHTIRSDYGGRPATAVFMNNRFEDGAKQDDVKSEKGMSLVFQSMLTVVVKDAAGNPVPGAEVTLTDKDGKEVFKGAAALDKGALGLMSDEGNTLALKKEFSKDAKGFVMEVSLDKGAVKIIVTDYTQDDGAKAPKGPYKLTVTKDGKAATREIDAATSQTADVKL